ncbi:MAG: hypothetical protein GX969_03190 [Firmicutes bacterium]|nr:hypothetical protein [Bacillota bacterium]
MNLTRYNCKKAIIMLIVTFLTFMLTNLDKVSAEPISTCACLSEDNLSESPPLYVYEAKEAGGFISWSGGERVNCQVGSDIKPAVQSGQSPLLFIGGNMGISGEVFFGDMPVADDPYTIEPGGDESDNNESGENEWDMYLPPKPSGITYPGVRHDLNLVIDGRLGESVQGYTRLSMSGVWGVSRPSDASPWMPSMIRPLLIDEAWIRYAAGKFQVRAGKQRFSLGPVGLLGRTDPEAMEGVVFDIGIEKWNLTVIWSRLSSGYYYNSSFVTSVDNLMAFRLMRPLAETWVLGLNYLSDGLGNETGASLDLQGNVGGRNVVAEIGMFKSSSTLYPEYRTLGFVPGLVLKAEAFSTPMHRLEFSYGYISQGFAPYYSAVASRSGGLWIPFDQNTQGILINYDRRLSSSTEINLEGGCLYFLNKEASSGYLTQSTVTPTFLASIFLIHELKTNVFLKGQYEYWQMENGSGYGRVTAGINLNF